MGRVDNGRERNEDGALGDTRAQAGGEDVQRLPEIGVAVPAEHQDEVAERGEGGGEDDESLVATRSDKLAHIAPMANDRCGRRYIPLDEHTRNYAAERVSKNSGNQVGS